MHVLILPPKNQNRTNERSPRVIRNHFSTLQSRALYRSANKWHSCSFPNSMNANPHTRINRGLRMFVLPSAFPLTSGLPNHTPARCDTPPCCVEGQQCSNGLPGVQKDDICCDASCGGCGESDCDQEPAGRVSRVVD